MLQMTGPWDVYWAPLQAWRKAGLRERLCVLWVAETNEWGNPRPLEFRWCYNQPHAYEKRTSPLCPPPPAHTSTFWAIQYAVLHASSPRNLKPENSGLQFFLFQHWTLHGSCPPRAFGDQLDPFFVNGHWDFSRVSWVFRSPWRLLPLQSR